MPCDTLPRNTVCLACGYHLAGLRADDVCSECGSPCAHSLLEDSIFNAGFAYISRLALGSRLVVYGQYVYLLGLLSAALAIWIQIPGIWTPKFLSILFPSTTGRVALAIGSTLWVAGWFIATPRDTSPNADNQQRTTRLILRGSILTALGLHTLGFVFLIPIAMFVAFFVMLAAAYVSYFVTLAWMRRNAARAGDLELAKSIGYARVAGVLAFVLFLISFAILLSYLGDSAKTAGSSELQAVYLSLIGFVLLLGLIAGIAGYFPIVHGFARTMQTARLRSEPLLFAGPHS
jgi:hypothetical protein